MRDFADDIWRQTEKRSQRRGRHVVELQVPGMLACLSVFYPSLTHFPLPSLSPLSLPSSPILFFFISFSLSLSDTHTISLSHTRTQTFSLTELLDADLVNLVEEIDARYVGPVALHNIDELV